MADIILEKHSNGRFVRKYLKLKAVWKYTRRENMYARFKCEIRGMKVNLENVMKFHMKRKHGGCNFSCIECELKFGRYRDLRKHTRRAYQRQNVIVTDIKTR